MRLYLSLGEVYHSRTVQRALDRIHAHEQGDAELFYIFVSEYAKLCVQQVVDLRCQGETFVTFVPPEFRKLLSMLKQSHPNRGSMVALRMEISAWYEASSNDLIQFDRLFNLIGMLRERTEYTPEEFKQKVKVTLEMNEIKTAYILIDV